MSESSFTPRQSLEYLGRMALGNDYSDGYEIAEAIWTLEEFLDAADEAKPADRAGRASCGDYPAPCNCDEGECPDRAGRAS